jgi:hypothetical protein
VIAVGVGTADTGNAGEIVGKAPICVSINKSA